MQSFNESSGTLRRFSHRTLCSWAGTVLPLLAPFVIYLVFILCYFGANIQRGLACILNSRLTLASGPKTRIEFGAEGK